MSLFNKSYTWSIEIYRTNEKEIDFENLNKYQKFFSLPSNHLRFSKLDPHTYADPFLFIWNGILYLFIETKSFNSPGKIECFFSKNFLDFEYFGEILSGENHFSFPNIFEMDGRVYMIPETSEVNEVSLYGFDNFPNGVRKISTLLHGAFFDTSIIKNHGLYFLLTSNNSGLHLFFSENLDSNYVEHPQSPITTDKKFLRNAGGIYTQGEKKFRFSQDCEHEYGKNVNLHLIELIDKHNYVEKMLKKHLFKTTRKKCGYHHISIAKQNDLSFIAIDIKRPDSYFNKLLSLFYRYDF